LFVFVFLSLIKEKQWKSQYKIMKNNEKR
jgi:hypothetical protein